MAVRRKQIRELVETLLDRYNITEAAVPVDRVVKTLGIEIKLDKVDDDLSGFLVREKKGQRRSVIGANKSHHPHRQRFTIAHELGHYLLHEGEAVHLDEYRQAFTINMRNSQSANTPGRAATEEAMAKLIIDLVQRGVRDPLELCRETQRELGISH